MCKKEKNYVFTFNGLPKDKKVIQSFNVDTSQLVCAVTPICSNAFSKEPFINPSHIPYLFQNRKRNKPDGSGENESDSVDGPSKKKE